MGIRFLQTFLCNDVPGGHFTVDIGREIQNWKRQNNDRAVIVFDVMGLLNVPLQSNTDIVLGGRHHIVVKKFEEFFQTLKENYGAELVFFCDGRVQKNKNDIWIVRQNEKYAKTITILDKIEASNGSLEFINKMRNDDIPGLTTTFHSLVNLCKRYGEFKSSMNVECDTELSRYAVLNNALAVVADDTDFLIYEGNWMYWSARSMNLVQLTTMEYSRSALRKALGLSQQQLPIFATFAGNDVISQDQVQPFHRRLRLTRYNRFNKLAQFVRSNKVDVMSITLAIFGSTTSQHVNLVQESINTYDIHYNCATNEMDSLQQKKDIGTCFYTFVNGLPYNITLIFSDLRRNDFLPYVDALLPILKRQIGFVRQHKNDENYEQKIIAKVDHSQSFKELNVSPEYPTIQIPSLLDITFDDMESEEWNPLRFELLTWLVFGCNRVFAIDKIPMNYKVLVTALKFLLDLNQITAMEADAVLLCVHRVRQQTIPSQISIGKVATRSIIVSHLYARMHITVANCFKFVGFERLIDYLIFDGPFYMVVLDSLSSQSESDYSRSVDEIQEYRQFLFK